MTDRNIIEDNPSNNTDEIIAAKRLRNSISYYLISFCQGAMTIIDLANSFFFKDELKVNPYTLSQIIVCIALPFSIKPLFGLLTDLVPIFGYRRKFYILICGVISIICWLLMSFCATELWHAITLLVINSGCISFSTVIGEALVVELSQLGKKDEEEEQIQQNNGNGSVGDAKDYVSWYFIFKTIGLVIASYLKGGLLEYLSIRTMYLIEASFPVLIIISGIVCYDEKIVPIEEQHHEDNDGVERISIWRKFAIFLTQKCIYIPTLFILLFVSVPSYNEPYFYFVTDTLKFKAHDLGLIALAATIAMLIGIIIYKCCLKNVNIKTILIASMIVHFIFSFNAYVLFKRWNIKIGMSDFWMALCSTSINSLIAEFMLMPLLSLACLLCPKDLEGTIYSFFLSAINLGSLLSNLFGSGLCYAFGITKTTNDNLGIMMITINILNLIPLIVILFVNSSYFNPTKVGISLTARIGPNDDENEPLNGNNNNEVVLQPNQDAFTEKPLI